MYLLQTRTGVREKCYLLCSRIKLWKNDQQTGPAHVKRVTLASEVNFEILMEVDSLIITE